MNSGMSRTTRAILRLEGLLLALGLLATPAWAAFDASALMQLIATHPGGSVPFEETRTLAVLDEPVRSTGELVYQPPDRLEKRTLQPEVETLIIDGDRVAIVQDGRKHERRLGQYPEMEALIAGLRGALLGKLALLQQYYKLEVSGDADNWTLVLTPVDWQVQRWLQGMTVRGSGNQMRAMDIVQADGDRSRIRVLAGD